MLSRDADPRVPAPDQLVGQVPVVGVGVDAAADVEPFDDDRAVEPRGVRRASDQDADAVGRAAVLDEVEPAIASKLTLTAVRHRPTGGDALLLQPALRQRRHDRAADEDSVPARKDFRYLGRRARRSSAHRRRARYFL